MSLDLFQLIFFFLFYFFILAVVILLALNLYFSVISGCPLVLTGKKRTEKIIEEADLKDGMNVLELGCGDGYFLRRCARLRKIKGLGVDVHGLAIWRAKLLARFQKINGLNFQRGDMFLCDISGARLIYLFLITDLMEKISPKLRNECLPGTIIISHGFKLPGFENELFKEIKHPEVGPSYQKNTYFYKISGGTA